MNKPTPDDIRAERGPSPEAIAEVLLRDYRIPTVMQQRFIRHGLANEVKREIGVPDEPTDEDHTTRAARARFGPVVKH